MAFVKWWDKGGINELIKTGDRGMKQPQMRDSDRAASPRPCRWLERTPTHRVRPHDPVREKSRSVRPGYGVCKEPEGAVGRAAAFPTRRSGVLVLKG